MIPGSVGEQPVTGCGNVFVYRSSVLAHFLTHNSVVSRGGISYDSASAVSLLPQRAHGARLQPSSLGQRGGFTTVFLLAFSRSTRDPLCRRLKLRVDENEPAGWSRRRIVPRLKKRCERGADGTSPSRPDGTLRFPKSELNISLSYKHKGD